MNTATELLRRALESLHGCDDLDTRRKIIFDIHTYLAAEPEAEPVAWTSQDELNALGTDVTCYMYSEPIIGEHNIPLYTRPEPAARKPMTEEEMADSGEVPHCEWDGFVAGVRFAEKHHGIGGSDGNNK